MMDYEDFKKIDINEEYQEETDDEKEVESQVEVRVSYDEQVCEENTGSEEEERERNEES